MKVHDFDMEEETPFLIMEYYPRGTLRRVHPEGEQVALPLVVSYLMVACG